MNKLYLYLFSWGLYIPILFFHEYKYHTCKNNGVKSIILHSFTKYLSWIIFLFFVLLFYPWKEYILEKDDLLVSLDGSKTFVAKNAIILYVLKMTTISVWVRIRRTHYCLSWEVVGILFWIYYQLQSLLLWFKK